MPHGTFTLMSSDVKNKYCNRETIKHIFPICNFTWPLHSPPIWWSSSWTPQCRWGSGGHIPTEQGSTRPEHYIANNMMTACQQREIFIPNELTMPPWRVVIVKWKGKKSDQCQPGLELFGAERMWDIFNWVTQTVGVVISRVDTPVEKTFRNWGQSYSPEMRMVKRTAIETVSLPFISRSMMRRVLDSVCHGIHFPILHDGLHPECNLSLSKHPLFHPLKQNQRFFNGTVSPWWWRCIVAFQFLPLLVAYVCMTPAERPFKKWILIVLLQTHRHARTHTTCYAHLRISSSARS